MGLWRVELPGQAVGSVCGVVLWDLEVGSGGVWLWGQFVASGCGVWLEGQAVGSGWRVRLWCRAVGSGIFLFAGISLKSQRSL